ncbi:diacylglycerol kinase family protein [Acinetobacter puyangensis]|uniref:Lipid kinase, YegS/Rv2252/BmrU family n=1 Tax=Acinetobacter puyangensis TaxID=1096779 RepID=A0A240ED52_9GAMM|nr:diacylglycerol kinase family protein [Acinetobacter puyangensis]SNX46637.1 lipid kinase, YegS/Rv2252/BmrU family [Acinetobacter puyangensis]
MHIAQPLSIVMNVRSGHHGQGHEVEMQLIAQTLEKTGFAVEIFFTTEDFPLQQCIRTAIARHQSFEMGKQGLIVAAGGDGTINAVAQALVHTQIELGILPLGTFNYVARALFIPIDLPDAVQNLIDGEPRAIHVGQVNQMIYLNNASIGLYPVIIENREYYNKKFGRFPLIAYLSGLDVLVKSHKHYNLQLKIDGQQYPLDTPMVFFGNNQLQLQDLRLKLAACAAQGKLAGVAIGKVSRWQLFRLMIKLLKGELEQAEDVYSFCADHVEISATRPLMKVALDGEILKLRTPLKFSVLHDAIQVRVPRVVTSV